ncbi:UNVERIFIED_CONTAM: hypothetical protein GTU68_059907 [Idotea baltica]|nr:hypothetical protein [Idotea baltica]
MLLIRRFEEKAGQLYGMGLIGGFCHLYIGQEAVVVGLEAAAEEGDKRITSYRDHGHMLACGMDPNGVMAELTGREGGYSKGKGGSMHMFSKEKHFYGGHGIVGAQVPLGAGLAFADKYKDNGRVTFTYFGDGAAKTKASSNEGVSTWTRCGHLPCIFVDREQQYADGTAQQRSTSSAESKSVVWPLAFRRTVARMDCSPLDQSRERNSSQHCRFWQRPLHSGDSRHTAIRATPWSGPGKIPDRAKKCKKVRGTSVIRF